MLQVFEQWWADYADGEIEEPPAPTGDGRVDWRTSSARPAV